MEIYNIPNLYCINLKHRNDRKNKMIERFKNRNIYDKIIFIDAVNKNSDIIKYYANTYGDFDSINRGEYACFASHLKALKVYLENIDDKNETAIICEDDVLLHNDFVNNLKIIIDDLPKDFTACSLCYFPIDKDKYVKISSNLKQMGLDNIWGTQMYLISKKYALECLFRYDQPNFGIDDDKDEIDNEEVERSDEDPSRTSEVILRKSLGYLSIPMLAIEECEDSDIRKVNSDFLSHTLAFCKLDYEDYSDGEAEISKRLNMKESILKSTLDYRLIKLIKYRMNNKEKAIKIAEKLLKGIKEDRLVFSMYDYSRIIDEYFINLYYTDKIKAKMIAQEYIKLIEDSKEFKQMLCEYPERLEHMNENFEYIGLEINI